MLFRNPWWREGGREGGRDGGRDGGREGGRTGGEMEVGEVGREGRGRNYPCRQNPKTHLCSFQLSHCKFLSNIPSLFSPFQMTAICRGRWRSPRLSTTMGETLGNQRERSTSPVLPSLPSYWEAPRGKRPEARQSETSSWTFKVFWRSPSRMLAITNSRRITKKVSLRCWCILLTPSLFWDQNLCTVTIEPKLL